MAKRKTKKSENVATPTLVSVEDQAREAELERVIAATEALPDATPEDQRNFDKHLIDFFQQAPFFAEISRHIGKRAITKTPDGKPFPTAGIFFNMEQDEFTLGWNPHFFKSLTDLQFSSVLQHEFYHFIFQHLSTRRRAPAKMWNIATDLAINSLIMDMNKGNRACLPSFCILPGEVPKSPSNRAMTPEEQEATQKLAELLASMPQLHSSEWYFSKLMQCAAESGQDMNDPFAGIDIDSFDDHDGWDGIPEEKRDYVRGRGKAIVESAVKQADQRSNGWGDIPQDLREEIRRSVSRVVNWRAVLRAFVGSIIRGKKSRSMKKINKRYPYTHPGPKSSRMAKLLIAIDQSGSVDDEMLELFFAELDSLNKQVEIDYLPFDCSADNKDITTRKKGQKPAMIRSKMGGTDFNAPTDIFNAEENRGRWNGLLIMTDGQAPAPNGTRQKRGWVLGKGCDTHFSCDEMKIKLDDAEQGDYGGAWR